MNENERVLFGYNKPTREEASTLASADNLEQAKLAKEEAAKFLLREQTKAKEVEEEMAKKEQRWKEYQVKHNKLN